MAPRSAGTVGGALLQSLTHLMQVATSAAPGERRVRNLRLLPLLFGQADQARQHILLGHDAVQILHLYRPAAAEAFVRKVRC